MENQKESVVGRKALADRTKGASHIARPCVTALKCMRIFLEFKKISDEDKLTAFKSLLKGILDPYHKHPRGPVILAHWNSLPNRD